MKSAMSPVISFRGKEHERFKQLVEEIQGKAPEITQSEVINRWLSVLLGTAPQKLAVDVILALMTIYLSPRLPR